MNVFNVLVDKGVIGFENLSLDVKQTFWNDILNSVTFVCSKRTINKQLKSNGSKISRKLITKTINRYMEIYQSDHNKITQNSDVVFIVVEIFIGKIFALADQNAVFEELRETVLQKLKENRDNFSP